MSCPEYKISYRDIKTLSVELEYAVALKKVEGYELLKIKLENTGVLTRFKNSSAKILKSMKRDGVIKLFVFENDLDSSDVMESIYLKNKYPFLSEIEDLSDSSIYIKL